MKVRPYRKCDVCGMEIPWRNTNNRLVIKRRFHRSYILDSVSGYNRIDLCPKCQKRMFEWMEKEYKKHEDIKAGLRDPDTKG